MFFEIGGPNLQFERTKSNEEGDSDENYRSDSWFGYLLVHLCPGICR